MYKYSFSERDLSFTALKGTSSTTEPVKIVSEFPPLAYLGVHPVWGYEDQEELKNLYIHLKMPAGFLDFELR